MTSAATHPSRVDEARRPAIGPRRSFGGPARAALAALGGVAGAAAFEPLGWAPLLLVAVASLSVAVEGVRGRRAFVPGLVFGVVFMLTLLPWIQIIGRDAWVGLSVLEGSFYGLLGVLLARVRALPGWPFWAATCWVAVDALRSLVPWGGFPWGRLAFATVDTPLAPAMSWVGTSGTSFLVALLGTTLAWLVLQGRRRLALAAPLVAGVVALAAVPAVLPSVVPSAASEEQPRLRVAAVQGNVPGEGMEAFAERRAVLNNHVRATLDLAERIDAGETARPDVVLWPENSTDIDPFHDPSVYADIQSAADAVDVPLLVGAMVLGERPGDVYNQGIVWNPGTGPAQRYSKTHPVPFGEYIPMRAQLATLFKRLDQIPRDMVPGTEPGALKIAGTTLGDVICFEVAYDELVRDVVDQGARLLVVQTNNATYMGTGQVDQQFAIARLRALETARYVAVVATNGISGLIAPDGSVLQRATPRTTQVLEADLPLLETLTPGVRFGRTVEVALLLLAGAGLLLAAVRERARRGARPAPGESALENTPRSTPQSTPQSTPGTEKEKSL